MTVLESILEGVREDLAAREAQLSFDVVKERAAKAAPPLDVMSVLRAPNHRVAETSQKVPWQREGQDVVPYAVAGMVPFDQGSFFA